MSLGKGSRLKRPRAIQEGTHRPITAKDDADSERRGDGGKVGALQLCKTIPFYGCPEKDRSLQRF